MENGEDFKSGAYRAIAGERAAIFGGLGGRWWSIALRFDRLVGIWRHKESSTLPEPQIYATTPTSQTLRDCGRVVAMGALQCSQRGGPHNQRRRHVLLSFLDPQFLSQLESHLGRGGHLKSSVRPPTFALVVLRHVLVA